MLSSRGRTPPYSPRSQPSSPTSFRSLLFAAGGRLKHEVPAPSCFHDLYLDKVEDALVIGRDQYDLRPFFRTRLAGPDPVQYRQDIFRDLERAPVRGLLDAFAGQMAAMHKMLALVAKIRDRQPWLRWFLNAVDEYCRAVAKLAGALGAVDLDSAGLSELRAYLVSYSASDEFVALHSESSRLLDDLAAVRYDLLMRGTKLTVGPFDDEADYTAQVLATFERFRQGDVKDHRAGAASPGTVDHVQVKILNMVAALHPSLFTRLAEFCERHKDYVDATVARAEREMQFYLAYLDYIAPLRRAGLSVTYPSVSTRSKTISADATFDLALGAKLIAQGKKVVTNEFHLDGVERILVVSGPNQGGKTTLARTFGQLCHLASIGCPVPGVDVHVFLPDEIYTHFEREEHIETLTGKLEDELNRIHDILDAATTDSVIVLNEIFSSTTLNDALELSHRILTRISDLDALCLCVSFIDELSRLNDKTVSMVSTVDPQDPAIRTYRLVRKAADGRAYAWAIAQKYRLTYDALNGRIT